MAKIKHLTHSSNSTSDNSLENAKKCIAEENYVDAKDEIERVLDAKPTDDRALNLLAIVMLKLEQYDKAIKIYEDLIARYPNTALLKTNLGVAYLKNNQAGDAVKEFSSVLQKEPGNKTVLKLYGKALLKTDRADEAFDAFTRAGMKEYAEKIKKHGREEAAAPEEDVVYEPTDGDHASSQRHEGAEREQENGSGQSIVSEASAQDRGAPARGNSEGQQPDSMSDAPPYPEEDIVEAERGPSAIDEQELFIEEEKGDKERPPEHREQPQSSVESAISFPDRGPEKEKAAPEDGRAHEEKSDEKPGQQNGKGLASLSEEASLSRFTAPVNFIDDSTLFFNLDGNLIYVRNKSVVSIGEGLTIEQAYKRYRGKDTKSIFADKKDNPVILVYGKGGLLIKCDFKLLKPFNLRNEAMFLNDERLMAFQGDLEWENGRVELSADKSINVTQMKGTADLFLGISSRLLELRVNTATPPSVRLDSLVGWYGKLIPRQSSKEHYSSDTFITFHGEGAVFIDA
ncbi:MAG: tetratricopeptide repeat protein [Deltaproteobacteria bacterium]|nr:tetratricopeptide repeat protein [Deltaproteobacteria bacterium]MCL5276404.1 tetratricopeptide repeat protein [Deltaproteobacteria bacterium]